MCRHILRFILLIVLLLATPLWSKTYYVSNTGLDHNSGTSQRPFRTIQHAADLASPGDTVIVRSGKYYDSSKTGTGSKLVSVMRGGTAGQYVTFRSEHKWGAVLDGLNNTTAEAWSFAADYIRVEDFEVAGFRDDGFSTYPGGKFIELIGNHIHHIGRYCTDSGIGRNGIFINAGPILIESNLIHDIGRFSAGENGCAPQKPYYKTNDHAIYLGNGNDVTIRNNVFYNNNHGWHVHVYPNSVNNLSILNNTFAFASPWNSGHIIIAVDAITNSRIENNIFYQPNRAAIYRHARSLPRGDTLTITNNVTTSKMALLLANGSIDPAIPGVMYSGNLENTDPQFIDPARNDFRLAPRSPAVGRGALWQ